MQYPSTTIKIHAAAFYFARISRDLHQLTDFFGVTEYAVRKWAKTPQWEKALDVFGYQGDRYFITKPTRDTERDAGDNFEKAHKAYIEAVRNGEPKHRLATIAGNAVGLQRRRIHAWAMKYNWRHSEATKT